MTVRGYTIPFEGQLLEVLYTLAETTFPKEQHIAKLVLRAHPIDIYTSF